MDSQNFTGLFESNFLGMVTVSYIFSWAWLLLVTLLSETIHFIVAFHCSWEDKFMGKKVTHSNKGQVKSLVWCNCDVIDLVVL